MADVKERDIVKIYACELVYGGGKGRMSHF
jgi:hypothetical protein